MTAQDNTYTVPSERGFTAPLDQLRNLLKKQARSLRWKMSAQRTSVHFMLEQDFEVDSIGDVVVYGHWEPRATKLQQVGETPFYCLETAHKGEIIAKRRESDGELFAVSIYSLAESDVDHVLSVLK